MEVECENLEKMEKLNADYCQTLQKNLDYISIIEKLRLELEQNKQINENLQEIEEEQKRLFEQLQNQNY